MPRFSTTRDKELRPYRVRIESELNAIKFMIETIKQSTDQLVLLDAYQQLRDVEKELFKIFVNVKEDPNFGFVVCEEEEVGVEGEQVNVEATDEVEAVTEKEDK